MSGSSRAATGPYSSGRSTNAVRSPAARAPARSTGWAATSISSPGSTCRAPRGSGAPRAPACRRPRGCRPRARRRAQVAVPREVDEQCGVARERCHYVTAAQGLESFPDVGPRVQSVPPCHQLLSLLTAVRRLARRAGRRASRPSKLPPRPRALVDFVEGRPVSRAPRRGQLVRIARHFACAERLRDNRTASPRGFRDRRTRQRHRVS